MIRWAPLAGLLCVQAFLLSFRLDLLPIWADELHTVQTVAHPVREIIPLVQGDVHPPLYFILLHYWKMLPLPWTGGAALRAFSAVWALLATVLLDLFAARFLSALERWLGLLLLSLSPCLLLYGRMARSYSMQAALTMLSVALLWGWMQKPGSVILAFGSGAALMAVLYTHYVPGLAVLAGFVVIGWRSIGLARTGAFCLALAAGYFPWAVTLADAARRWAASSGFSAKYALTGSRVLEPVVKLGFGLVSLTIGESFLVGSLLLVPILLLLAVWGARSQRGRRREVAVLAVASVVGYLGVSRWVSYPFIAARLLWLLPFLSTAVGVGIARLKPPLRWSVLALVLLSYVSSIMLYFRREGFLNFAYAAPVREIAAILNRDAAPRDLILMDAYDSDPPAIAWLLSGRTPYLVLDQLAVPQARRGIGSAATVWIVRNTRDISPGHITTLLEREACADRPERDMLLEPYAGWQQDVMKMAGFDPPLTHFYQLTVCGPKARESGR